MTAILIGTTASPATNAPLDYVWYCKYTASQTGVLKTIGISVGITGYAKVALYSDNGGIPGTRLTHNSDGTSVTAGAYRQITVPDYNVTSGTAYWLAVIVNTTGTCTYSGGVGIYRWYSVAYAGYTFPASAESTTLGAGYEFCINGYGDVIVVPTVTTQAASSVEETTCTGNGNITATGGENCTRQGFCYKTGTSGDPTTADSVAYDDGSFGAGAYAKSITSLTEATSYRVRAYAVNSAGTGYGATVQARTKIQDKIIKPIALIRPRTPLVRRLWWRKTKKIISVCRAKTPSRKMWWSKVKKINYVLAAAILQMHLFLHIAIMGILYATVLTKNVNLLRTMQNIQTVLSAKIGENVGRLKGFAIEVLLIAEIMARNIYEEILKVILLSVPMMLHIFGANRIIQTSSIMVAILDVFSGINRIINAFMQPASNLSHFIAAVRMISAEAVMLPQILAGMGKSLFAAITNITTFDFSASYNRMLATIVELKRQFQNYFNDIETLRASLVMLPSQLSRMMNLSSILSADGILAAIKAFNVFNGRSLNSQYVLAAVAYANIFIKKVLAASIILDMPDAVSFAANFVRTLQSRILAIVRLLNSKGKILYAQLLSVPVLDRLLNANRNFSIAAELAVILAKIFGDIEILLAQTMLAPAKSSIAGINRLIRAMLLVDAVKSIAIRYNRLRIAQIALVADLKRRFHDIEVLIISNLHMVASLTRGFAKLLAGIQILAATKSKIANWRLTKVAVVLLISIVSRIKKHKGMAWLRFREYINENYR